MYLWYIYVWNKHYYYYYYYYTVHQRDDLRRACFRVHCAQKGWEWWWRHLQRLQNTTVSICENGLFTTIIFTTRVRNMVYMQMMAP